MFAVVVSCRLEAKDTWQARILPHGLAARRPTSSRRRSGGGSIFHGSHAYPSKTCGKHIIYISTKHLSAAVPWASMSHLTPPPAAIHGARNTTTTGPTVRWVVCLRRSSRVAVLPPFRLCLNSSSTATPYPLPKHYSHNTWTENGGTSMGLAAKQESILPRSISFVSTCKYLLSNWDVAGFSTLNPDGFIRHLLRCISQCRAGYRPGRFEPRCVKRRRDQYQLMMEPRNKIRQRLCKGDNSFE